MAAPVQIGVVVEDEEVQTALQKLLAKAADIRPVLDGPIDRSVTRFFERQFKTQGWFGGEPWKPLSPVTIRMKAEGRGRGRAGASTILQDTREMMGSFVKRGSPLGLRVLTPMTLIRGSRMERAARAQFGWTSRTVFGKRRRTTKVVPPRRIVPTNMPLPVTRAWTGMIEAYITNGSLKLIDFS